MKFTTIGLVAVAALTQTKLVVAAAQEEILDQLKRAGPETLIVNDLALSPLNVLMLAAKWPYLLLHNHPNSVAEREQEAKEAEQLAHAQAEAQADLRWNDLQHGPVKGTEDYKSDEITNNILNGEIKGTKEYMEEEKKAHKRYVAKTF